MAEINDLNITDASNTTRWPENMAPSAVNNAGRADEGLLARWHKDTNASKASTGSANAYVFAADQTISAYYDGLVIAFDANFENTGAATLNVDAVSADTIKKHNDQDLAAGDIEAGQKVWVVHDGTNWQMVSPTARGGSPITTRGDIVRGSSADVEERLALGTAKFVPTSDGTDVAYAEVPLSRGAIDGLILSNNATDATNDIDIAAGVTRDTADTANLAVTTAIGKQLDVSWATGGTPGTPTGGLSSSLTLTNDTWYHAIAGKVSGTVEVGFDTSITGANLVTDHSFTNTRIIGSIFRGTATNLVFDQVGDFFQWDVVQIDANAVAIGTTSALATISTPLGRSVKAYLQVVIDHASLSPSGYFSSPLKSDEAATVAGRGQVRAQAGSAGLGTAEIVTNTSSQIRVVSQNSSSTYSIGTVGWTDPRGKDS